MRPNGLCLNWATRSQVQLRGTGQGGRHQCESTLPTLHPTPRSKGTTYAQDLASISRHTQLLELLEKQGQTRGGYFKYLRVSG